MRRKRQPHFPNTIVKEWATRIGSKQRWVKRKLLVEVEGQSKSSFTFTYVEIGNKKKTTTTTTTPAEFVHSRIELIKRHGG